MIYSLWAEAKDSSRSMSRASSSTRGYTWQVNEPFSLPNTEGIYGCDEVNVASTYITIFIAFGEVAVECGMGQVLQRLRERYAQAAPGAARQRGNGRWLPVFSE